ncbi:nicotinate (nicotinamide) nucleotide adenylyltransferase [Parabacteroides sp. ZJ-118]|uniref:nicotinate (nicotinamide) nucleotide adenylyltransferase n=1 Tax=Parabacteroides sp. ZJ-118 TaxID=2709398 RepID=UPI0013EB8424|nr:nicotinate (nicotinamide) nucleotide adenylyltransferase [Parabacteroides sp. ZJ-118]
MGLKTGIYSGSFNPIHIGHLALANWLCEFEGLDEVWFVVTPHNPLKEKEGLLDDALRLEMTRAAIDGYPKFKACDVEFHLPRPSYSIDTLRTLSRNYPDRDFYFIMGADNWQLLPRWKEHEEILRSYKLLIYPRRGFDISIPEIYPDVRKVDAPLLEISSSFIRDAYQAGKDIRFFLPEGVRPYYATR